MSERRASRYACWSTLSNKRAFGLVEQVGVNFELTYEALSFPILTPSFAADENGDTEFLDGISYSFKLFQVRSATTLVVTGGEPNLSESE